MKFVIYTKESNGNILTEPYDLSYVTNPEEYGRSIVKEFNETLKSGELSREFLHVENRTFVYFADLIGDLEDEAEIIKNKLKNNYVYYKKFEITDIPDVFEDRYFDVLFFDWGGMSMGNSLMESFCKQILEHAREHPSKIYVMTSSFTEMAMRDILIDSNGEVLKIANIFLTIDDAIPYLKGGK